MQVCKYLLKRNSHRARNNMIRKTEHNIMVGISILCWRNFEYANFIPKVRKRALDQVRNQIQMIHKTFSIVKYNALLRELRKVSKILNCILDH